MTYPGQDGGPWQPQGPLPQQPPQNWGTPQGTPPQGWGTPPGTPQSTPPQGMGMPPQQPMPGMWQPGDTGQFQQYPGQPPIQYPIGQYPIGQPPQRKRRSGLIIGVVVAVVVAAGGVGTWFAFSHASTTGAASPEDAATQLVADISKGDVLGVVNDLPPAEASLVRDTLTTELAQLKRLNIYKQNASPQDAVGAANIKASDLKFDTSAVEHVNDHLAITKLVSGTITVSSSFRSDAFTDSFLHAAFPHGMASSAGAQFTVDIAHVVSEIGGPIRIATEQVGGRWYPSMFYTIADAALHAAHQDWPTTSVPAVGATSPDDAVQQFAEDALNGDIKDVIGRTAPDEMAALHDAGQALIDAAGPAEPSGIQIVSVTFQDRQVLGGVDAIVQSITLDQDGNRLSIAKSGNCYSIKNTEEQQSDQLFCGSDIMKQVLNDPESDVVPPAFERVLADMTQGLMTQGVGVVATESNGQWFVAPGRTLTQLVGDVYSSLSPSDITALLGGH